MKKIMSLLFLFNLTFAYGDVRPTYSRPVAISKIQTSLISEASGISISVKNPGIAWVHNDSGGSASVYAIRLSDGACMTQIAMTGASNSDIEDIALGNYQGVETLFLADIGDNKLKRGVYTINVLPEPEVKGLPNCAKVPLPVKKIKFQYPDKKAHNSEAIAFSQEFQKLYIITKAHTTEMFEFRSLDMNSSQVNTLEKLGNLSLTPITAADMSRDGEGLIFRNYREIREVRKMPGEDVSHFLKLQQVKVPTASEPQGEAVGYDELGNYYHVSEGKHQPIYMIKRIQ